MRDAPVMTVFAYALYRCARQLMTPEETAHAQGLAAKADTGDQSAGITLRALVLAVVLDADRLPDRKRKAA